MTLSRALLLLAAAASIAPSAYADDASKQAKVHELLTTLKLDQVGDRIEKQVYGQVAQHALQGIPPDKSAADQKSFETFTTTLKTELDTSLGWKVLEPLVAKVYMDNFTEPEVTSILDFYKTPAGQKLLSNEPVVAEASQKVINTQLETLKPTILKQMDDFIAQSKANQKAAPSLTPRTSPPPSSGASAPPASSTAKPNATPAPH